MVMMRTTAMAMVAQDEEHEETAQEMSTMSLGLQISFFLLYFVFVLLTNILGTSYLQGRRNEDATTEEEDEETTKGRGRTREMTTQETSLTSLGP
jgi:hypothetical protein